MDGIVRYDQIWSHQTSDKIRMLASLSAVFDPRLGIEFYALFKQSEGCAKALSDSVSSLYCLDELYCPPNVFPFETMWNVVLSRKRGHDELDESITLQEVVEIDQHLEDDARALLGSANDSVCTYPEGYPPRQMIYACKTCTSSSELAAICYGCSIHCHDEHDVIELYTKRKEKEPLNARNQYNHNYAGLYCICDRPYPSTDFDDGGDMVQCIICEDWFHTEVSL
ncbi:unnamed protein product [Toxocara canis]|uniref:UBR-type domain-containing protein n=1 Tax=Toxocara canis TaxID=6265 RepID=A0A183UPC6_TOXCA|nr:unnamed protein product [Toxocara canis]